jgi:hypothetical protein
MSDQEYGKKLTEEMELEPFLVEYELVTGLTIDVAPAERPDFIGQRSDNTDIGIELAKVTTDPEFRFCRQVLNRKEHMDPADTAIYLQELIYRKDTKRASPGWALPDHTILVVQLMESLLEEVTFFLDEEVLAELNATGFLEIWLADYNSMEAYKTVQLFGIKPKKWQGIHSHSMTGTKPYG